MKHIYKISIVMVLILAIIAGCGIKGNETKPEDTGESKKEGTDKHETTEPLIPEESKGKTDFSKENTALKSLLPKREDYTWKYSGFAEYGHQMTLNEISTANEKTCFKITGSVDDMSGGEAQGDFSMNAEYVISKGELIQNIKGEKLMDAEFKNLVLIKTPLEKGNTWTQSVVNKDNVQVELECKITDVMDNGLITYRVRYEQKQGEYYEEREIREETGIVSFKRLFVSGADKYDIGYFIYENASGYTMERELKTLLPPEKTVLRYFGLAEYAHVVTWENTFLKPEGIIYEFNGEFRDGSGVPGNFKIQYELDKNNFTITENVTENTRSGEKKVNSIFQGMVILKAPVRVGNSWKQEVKLNENSYTMNSLITEAHVDKDNTNFVVYTVKYTVEGLTSYFNDMYIQERKFKTGRGMIAFSQLMEGNIGLEGKELEDRQKVEQALINHMFGYAQDLH